MFGVTKEYKNIVARNGRRWKARVQVSQKVFDDRDIISIDLEEATLKGETFEVGSVVANKLTLAIVPSELLVYDNVLVQAWMSLEVAADQWEEIPLGKFRVSETQRERHKITLTCYDDMTQLAYGYFPQRNPDSIAGHIQQIRTASGIEILGAFPSDSVEMPVGLTYREAIGYIAAYMGGFARFDRQGRLEVRGYSGMITEVDAGNLVSAEAVKAGVEYVAAADLGALPDEELILEFEARVSSPGPVFLYALGKYDIGNYFFMGTDAWQKYQLRFRATVTNPAAVDSVLSLYSVYGSGRTITTRGLTVRVAEGSGIDYGAYGFKIVDGSQYAALTLAEKNVSIGRVTGTVGGEVVTLGALGHEVVVDCPFMSQSRLQHLYNQLKAVSYRPYEVSGFRGDPSLEAGDRIALIDEFGAQYDTIVTHNRVKYRGAISQELKGRGLSEKAQAMQPVSRVDKEFQKIYAEQISVRELLAGKITVQDLVAWTAEIDNLKAVTAYIDNATVNFLTASDAEITYARIDELDVVNGRFDDLSATYAAITDLNAVSGHVTVLSAAHAELIEVVAGKINAESITAEYLKGKMATITDAWITNAMIDTASVNRLMIDQTNIKTAAILDAHIKNLSATVLTSGFINAGRIATNSISLDKLESGISGKLGIVAQDEITLQITGAVNDLSVGGGENITPGLGNLHGLEIVSWDISSVMDGAARAFSFDLMASRATEVLVYSKGDYEIGNWYLKAGTTSKRYGVGGKPKKVANTGVTTLYFYAVYKSGVSLTVANRKAESGSVVTGLDMGAYVPKTEVKSAISLSQEEIRITGKHLRIDAATSIDVLAVQQAKIFDAVITNAMIEYGKAKAFEIGHAVIGDAWITEALIHREAVFDSYIVELSANKITSGELSVERLIIRGTPGTENETKSIIYALNNIGEGLESIPTDTILGDVITDRTITGAKVVAETIVGTTVIGETVKAGHFASRTIDALDIKAGTITANEVKANSITADRLAAKTIKVGSGVIDDAAITTAMIASVKAEKVTADWLEAGKIKANSLTTSIISAEQWASLDLASNTSIRLAVSGNAINLIDGSASKSALEYINYADLNSVLGVGAYTLSFDLYASIPGEVLVYTLGKYDIGNHYVKATTGKRRYHVMVDVSLRHAGAPRTDLSFYGVYKSGRQITVSDVMLSEGRSLSGTYHPYSGDLVKGSDIFTEITLDKKYIVLKSEMIYINGETKIQDASIDVAKIKNLTVESAKINWANIDMLEYNQATGTTIKAESITTNHVHPDFGKNLDITSNSSITLAVGGALDDEFKSKPAKNLISGGAFENGLEGWTLSDAGARLGYAAGIDRTYVEFDSTVTGSIESPPLQLVSGKSYRFSVRYLGRAGRRYRLQVISASDTVLQTSYITMSNTGNWDNWVVSSLTGTAANSNGMVRLRFSPYDASGIDYVTEFQLEEGTARTEYEHSRNGLTGGIGAVINLNNRGVIIAGESVAITGKTYIADGTIQSAHIGKAAIMSANIGTAQITDAHIKSLSADSIKTGILRALKNGVAGESYIDLQNDIFNFVNATFISSVGSQNKVEIKDGSVYATDGRLHAKLEKGMLHLYPTNGEFSSGTTKLTHETGLGFFHTDAYLGIGTAGQWSGGSPSKTTPTSEVVLSMTESKVQVYSTIIHHASTTSIAGGGRVTMDVVIPVAIDLKAFSGFFVNSLVDGIVCAVTDYPIYTSWGSINTIRITFRNVTSSYINKALRASLMIVGI